MQKESKRYIGIWIDHKITYLVCINNKNITFSKIESHIPSHHRSAGGTRSSGAIGEVVSDSRNANKFKHHLDKYYDNVISKINKPTSLLIIGPGRAKRELLRRIEESHLNNTGIAGVETADKMSEKQIIAYVKEFFHAE